MEGTQYQSAEPKTSGPHGVSISPLHGEFSEKKSISVDELIKAVPNGVEITPKLRKTYNLARYQAQFCHLEDVVNDLVMIGEDLNETIDNMAMARHRDTITEKEHDDFIEKLEEFQWSTIPKEIREILVSSCGCKIA